MNITRLILTLLLLLTGSTSLIAGDWQEVPFPLEEHITGISITHADTIQLVTGGGKHARSYDGGANWWGLQFPGSAVVEDAHFVDGRRGLVVGRRGLVYLTHDGGETWIDRSWPDSSAMFVSCYMFDLNRWLVVGMIMQPGAYHPGIALSTIDGGSNWTKLDVPGQAIGDIFCDDNKNVSMLSLGFINQSSDRGQTWRTRQTGNGLPGRAVAFQGNWGIAVGNMGMMATSSDSGQTWKQRTVIDENVHLTSVEMVDGKTAYVGGTNGTLMKTVDGGVTWTPENIPTPLDIFDMELFGDWLWVVGSEGHIIRKQNP